MSYLTEDPYSIRVPTQNFACVSFVGPDLTQKSNNGYALKVRGVFATLEEASKHCKAIQAEDPDFDVWTMDMYKWVPFPPKVYEVDPERTAINYQEEALDGIIKGYFEQMQKQKVVFNERKEAVMKDGLDAHLLPGERVLPPPGVSQAIVEHCGKLLEFIEAGHTAEEARRKFVEPLTGVNGA
jgi:hypothetical protein